MDDASSSLGLWPLRELVASADVVQAAEDAATWGFSRPIEPDEIIHGAWFRMGEGVVFWFEAPHEADPTAAILHLVVEPSARLHWPVRRWDAAVDVIAELMGSTHLLAAPICDKTRAYMLRLGWQASDGPRLVRWLGGSHGREGQLSR